MKQHGTAVESRCQDKSCAGPFEHTRIKSPGGFWARFPAPWRKVPATVFLALAAILAPNRVSLGSAETLAEPAPPPEPHRRLEPSLPQVEPGRLLRDREVGEGLRRRLDEMRERVRLRDEQRETREPPDYQLILPDATSPAFPPELFTIQPEEDEQ
jgi:hypothetical protein